MTREVIYDSENDSRSPADLAQTIWDANSLRILTYGTSSHWDGPINGGRYLDSAEQIRDRIANSGDHVTVRRVLDRKGESPGTKAGDIVIEGSHHDGTNVYTLRGTDPDADDAEDFMEFKAIFDSASALEYA